MSERVLEAFSGAFRGVQRSSRSALQEIRRSFSGFTETFQEVSDDFKRGLEALQRRFWGFLRILSAL